MRKRYALLGFIPFGIMAACEDADGGGSLNPSLDGSTPAVDGSTTLPDGGDAGPQPVTVLATRSGKPLAGIAVVYQDADGTVVATETTNAAGIAAHLVPTGSQVTIVFGTATEPRLTTITDVEPGDQLAAVDARGEEQDPEATITALPAQAPNGAEFYARVGNCYGNTFDAPPNTFQLYRPECYLPGKFPVLITATKEGEGEVGFTFKKGNTFPIVDGGFGVPEIAVTQAWSTAIASHTITVAGAVQNQYGYTAFSEVADDVASTSTLGRSWGSDAVTPGPFSVEHSWHPGYPDYVQSEFGRYDRVPGDENNRLFVVAVATREATPAGNATTAFTVASLLPIITGATLDQATTNRPSVTWTTEAPLTGIDGAFAYISWSAGNGNQFGTWSFVTAPNRTSIKAPALPGDLAGFAPPLGDGGVDVLFSTPVVGAVDATFLEGYRDARKAVAGLASNALINWNGDAVVPPLPVAGTLRVTAYTRPID